MKRNGDILMTMEKKLSVKTTVKTRMAINCYEKIRKMQLRIAKLEKELYYWVSKIPDEDLEEYIRRTNEIDKEFEEMEAILK
jgi:hypothetical protein